jgi:pimeloyl-ACP methyl ester carboxylesterase
VADVTVRGVRLHVQRLGTPGEGEASKPVVVFLHGLVMDNLSSWFFTVANPATRVAEAILYDLRGHGLSERPKTGYGLADHVADLAALLDALGVSRPVVLVGNSFGGLLALAFARAHAARVAGVVLVDGHLGDEGFGAQMSATLRLTGEERDRKIAESFAAWLGRHSERKRTRLADNARDLVENTTLVDDMQRTPALVASDLEALGTRILGLYGENSDIRARSVALLAHAPNASVVVLPGCSHSVLWEATDEVRTRILTFLSERGHSPAGSAAE